MSGSVFLSIEEAAHLRTREGSQLKTPEKYTIRHDHPRSGTTRSVGD